MKKREREKKPVFIKRTRTGFERDRTIIKGRNKGSAAGKGKLLYKGKNYRIR